MADNVRHSYTAGGVVAGPSGHIIVVNQNNNSWSLPKGHIEPGETELEAAIREIREESGITQLEFVGKLGHYARHRIGLQGVDDTSIIKSITLFLFKTPQEQLSPEDPDNPVARWVPINEVAGLLTHQKDKEFFISTTPKIKQLLPQ